VSASRWPATNPFSAISKVTAMKQANNAARTAITAAIVNYGSPDDTVRLAKLLQTQVARVIVVDNSGDVEAPATPPAKSTVRWWSARPAPAFELLNPGRNLGYGAAVNLAAARATTRWLLLLNPDTRPLDDCIGALLEAALAHQAPLCGPRFYWDDARQFLLPPALGYTQWLGFAYHCHGSGDIDHHSLALAHAARHDAHWLRREPFAEPFLSGALMLVDLQWFRAHQEPVFDERFFLYYEDTDLCARLLRHGQFPLCVPTASAVHYWNQAPEPPAGKQQLMQASEAIYREKFFPEPLPLPALPPRFAPASVDLGDYAQSAPLFPLPAGTARLDLGMEPNFMQYMQTVARGAQFRIPDQLWQQLKAGAYHARARDSAGRFLGQWHWRKQQP
jgi:GT2 family glycosyltransferase